MSKAAKHRMCPATGHEITSAECGEHRGSKYACPPECAFSPMAPENYAQLLDLETAVDLKASDWLVKAALDKAALEAEIRAARNSNSKHALNAVFSRGLFFRKTSDGQTIAQRWEMAGFPGLKNDERVLVRAKMQMRVALIEVRCVLDNQRIEMVDLISEQPKPFIVRDRSFAATVGRFGTFLCWIYPLPHYWRMHGTGIGMPEFESFDAREILLEIVRHLGGPLDEPGMRAWLAVNFVRFDESLHEVGRARHRMMLEGLEGKFADVGKARAAELAKPDFALIPTRLLSNPTKLIVSTSEVPFPLNAKSKEEIEVATWAYHDRRWLDESLEVFAGKTPKQAALDPALRPLLIPMMKSRVRRCDERNVRTGSNHDVNWMLRELGLDELNFPPPPRRAVSVKQARANLDDEEFPQEKTQGRPMPPPLPQRPFTKEEVRTILAGAARSFKHPPDALAEMRAAGSTLIEDLGRITADSIDERMFRILVPSLIHIWLLFVPIGTRGPELNIERLTHGISKESQLIKEAMNQGSQAAYNLIMRSGPQPEAVEFMIAMLTSSLGSLPKKASPTPLVLAFATVLFKATIEEMDLACREQVDD